MPWCATTGRYNRAPGKAVVDRLRRHLPALAAISGLVVVSTASSNVELADAHLVHGPLRFFRRAAADSPRGFGGNNRRARSNHNSMGKPSDRGWVADCEDVAGNTQAVARCLVSRQKCASAR